jgi:DNA-directed RNA polymerase specialized sigma24 family protein
MPSTSHDLVELLQQARAGSHEASRLVVKRFSEPIRRVIRRGIDPRLRATCDPEDILQMVWRDFFSRSLWAQSFSTPEQLVAYLTRMSLHKLHQARRQHLATRKRGSACQADFPDDLADPHPQAEQLAASLDDWNARLRGFPPIWRQAFTMLRDGYTRAEVAQCLGLCQRRLERFLARLRARQRLSASY